MTPRRLGFVSIGTVLLATLIWVARSPNGEISPAAEELSFIEPQSEVSGPPVYDQEQQITESTEALTEAQAEIERLRAELAAATALSDEQQDADLADAAGSEAYSGAARAFASDARSVFEAEGVDASWAPGAQSELIESINKRIVDDGLAMNLVDVRCGTEACRIQFSFSQPATNPSESGNTSEMAFKLSHQVAKEANSVSFSGLFVMRRDFPGEPASGELFLFRSGNDGVFLGMETPRGSMLLCGQASCFPEVEI